MNTDQSQLAAAYERRLPEILAISDADLVPINIDLVQTVVTVLGTLPEIRHHQEALRALPNVDQHLIEGLEDYANAAGEAISRHNTDAHGKDELNGLLEQGTTLRDTFRLDGAALARHGLVKRDAVETFKNLSGYKHVGADLVDWATLFMSSWSRIEGKTALTLEEVNAAKALGRQLLAGLGEREQGPAVRAEAAKIRHRAVTLLMKAYDETRRAMTFLRWNEGDADLIAPSLYAGRRRRAAPIGDLAAMPDTGPVAVVTPTTGPAAAATPTPGPVAATPTAAAPVANGNGASHDVPFGVAQVKEVTQH